MPKPHEKRTTKRRHLIYYLHVYDLLDNELIGHIVDITPEGLMIIGDKPVPVERDFNLRMTLPSEIMGRDTLEFEARSIWCKKDADPTLYGTGFRLKDVDSEESRIIRRLIKDFGFQD